MRTILIDVAQIAQSNPGLTVDELDILARTLTKGRLRASKPPVERRTRTSPNYTQIGESAAMQAGCAAYVWRMVAFQVSDDGTHQCMPVTADFDIPADFTTRREICKRLDVLVTAVVDSLPPSEWAGILRWGRAFGATSWQQG